jgi:branched-chain amino acid transport system permease protein
LLILVFGVDYRYVSAAYIDRSYSLGFVQLPMRMVVPCVISLAMLGSLQLFLGKTFLGRAIMAVAQDQGALRLMAADPIKIKRIAFALSIATCALAGACLIIIQPVEPSTCAGPSWAPAVAFGLLLLTLAVRPAGLLGR